MHKSKNKKGEKKVHASCRHLSSPLSKTGWDEMSLEFLEGVKGASDVGVEGQMIGIVGSVRNEMRVAHNKITLFDG